MFKREAGILLVVLNHSGDIMSANMACQLAERVGIKVKSIITHDDISAGLDAPDEDRRGLAGCVPLIKVVGAAAEEGKSLDEILEIGERMNAKIATKWYEHFRSSGRYYGDWYGTTWRRWWWT